MFQKILFHETLELSLQSHYVCGLYSKAVTFLKESHSSLDPSCYPVPGVSPAFSSVCRPPPRLPSLMKAQGEPLWWSHHTKQQVFIYVHLLPPHLDLKTVEDSRFHAGDLEGEVVL